MFVTMSVSRGRGRMTPLNGTPCSRLPTIGIISRIPGKNGWAGKEKLTIELRAKGIPFVEVQLDVDEINQFYEEHGIPRDSAARARLAALKAE